MSLAFEAIGTAWSIEMDSSMSAGQERELTRAIIQRIERFDLAYSRFRPDSLVSQMAQEAGRYRWPEDGRAMLEFYRELYAITAGKVTPLIGQTMNDAGYDAEYSLQPEATVRQAPEWEAVLDYKHPWLTLKEPAWLDFGAAGKGHLVDIVAEIAMVAGAKHFVVDAGGDMLVRSSDEGRLRIGLEHPFEPEKVIGVAELSDQSICGSAGNRRAWGAYHHIIDPHSAEPVSRIVATWVVADSTLQADGLATALFFTQPETLKQHLDFEYVMMREDGIVQTSDDFRGEIFGRE